MSAQQLLKPGASYAYVLVACARCAAWFLKCPELLQTLQLVKDDGLCPPLGHKPRFSLCTLPCNWQARLEVRLPALLFLH